METFVQLNCYNDWAEEFIDRAIDHFGRLTEPKHLTEQNAWIKQYDYRSYRGEEDEYIILNLITKERRPITEQQYNDSNYTLNSS